MSACHGSLSPWSGPRHRPENRRPRTMESRSHASGGGVKSQLSVMADHLTAHAGPCCRPAAPTNCWVLILLASFAPIRGSADDRMTAPSTGGFGPGGLAALAELLISAEAAVVLVMVAVVPGGNTASPARAEGDGMVPRGTVALPNTEKNNMAEGEKIFKMIVVPREDQDVADREVRYVCGCRHLC